MEIRLSDKAKIELSSAGLTPELLAVMGEVCTFQNPEFKKREGLGYSTWNLDPEFKLYKTEGSTFVFSRGLVGKIVKLLKTAHIDVQIVNELTIRRPTKFNFQARLADDQIEFYRAITENGGGLYVAPCGLGKTVIGLSLVDFFQGKTLIIVHTKKLLIQWMEAIEKFLGIPIDEIGMYGAGKKFVGEKITVGLMQSLIRDVDRLVDEFDVVFADEAHHCPCETLFGIVNNLRSAVKIGCTATPRRKDRKEFLLFASLGEIAYSSRGDPSRRMAAAFYIIETDFFFPHYNQVVPPIIYGCEKYGQDLSKKLPECKLRACEDCILRWEREGVDYSRPCDHRVTYQRNHTILLTKMGEDTARNYLILQYVVNLHRAGVKMLVLFNRIDIICRFRDALARLGIEAGLVIGGTRPGVDVEVACKQFRAGQLRVLIGSSVADEGLDLPELEAVIFGSPCANHPGLLEQRLGRAERIAPGKTRSLGVYFLDSRVFTGHQKMLVKKYPQAKSVSSFTDIKL